MVSAALPRNRRRFSASSIAMVVIERSPWIQR
jgi:hypothetical protein